MVPFTFRSELGDFPDFLALRSEPCLVGELVNPLALWPDEVVRRDALAAQRALNPRSGARREGNQEA
jgi:hypothetical protein